MQIELRYALGATTFEGHNWSLLSYKQRVLYRFGLFNSKAGTYELALGLFYSVSKNIQITNLMTTWGFHKSRQLKPIYNPIVSKSLNLLLICIYLCVTVRGQHRMSSSISTIAVIFSFDFISCLYLYTTHSRLLSYCNVIVLLNVFIPTFFNFVIIVSCLKEWNALPYFFWA